MEKQRIKVLKIHLTAYYPRERLQVIIIPPRIVSPLVLSKYLAATYRKNLQDVSLDLLLLIFLAVAIADVICMYL